ncbi:hypothetical protein L249_2988 [Ophiocordyceps polyrhachis-furcata BCC 54312]|uniref:Cell wall protein PhiA n=1 Tax=Ophiocordyceps polyrhachis-furcata BCC 54312 TaxID=1330021 RepID=A0A367LR80_9HYPO|nr:hypothetical protein L249_2988 [Ophiocordyceps polyrhachis-furcata BCC 54312]
MKLSKLVATIVAASVGPALADDEPAAVLATAPGSKPFQLMSLRSASRIHFGQVSASQSSIFINLPKQGAKCEGDDPKSAIFYLKDQQLYLYTGSGPVQRLFVDRSGFGQGKLGYLTGNGPVPSRFEVKGWNLRNIGKDKSSGQALYFHDKNLMACPGSVDNSWSVWVVTDNGRPGGNEGCLGFTPLVLETVKPVHCEYKH